MLCAGAPSRLILPVQHALPFESVGYGLAMVFLTVLQ